MTPQLQQAIRLLQLSTMELSVEIQEALDSNMMLELADGAEDYEDYGSPSTPDSVTDEADFEAPFEIGGGDPAEAETAPPADDIPQELPVDSDWDEIYDTLTTSGTPSGDGAGNDFERASSFGPTLAEHLAWQLNLMPLNDADKTIAMAIIDALDSDGYLSTTIEELCATVGAGDEEPVEPDEIIAVLKLVQGLEPTGVGAAATQ